MHQNFKHLFWKVLLRKWKNKVKDEYLPNIYLLKDYYLEVMKNSSSSLRRHITLLKICKSIREALHRGGYTVKYQKGCNKNLSWPHDSGLHIHRSFAHNNGKPVKLSSHVLSLINWCTQFVYITICRDG